MIINKLKETALECRLDLLALVILLVGGLSGCKPMYLTMVDPPGPPEYSLGWEDGCDSGLTSEGGWEYKMVYGFKKRPEFAGNEQYKIGWNEGFTYCRFSLNSSQSPASWSTIGLGDGF